MKKLFIFFFVIMSLFLTTFEKPKLYPIFEMEDIYSVCFVVDKDKIAGEKINCGNKDFVFMSKEEAKENVSKFKTYSLQFYIGSIDCEKVLKLMKANIVERQNVENYEILYCYTPFVQDAIYIESKKCNMQVVLKDGGMIVGMPIVLTGY